MDISKHAKERYGERIMDKDNKADINRFIIENEEKITTDINKMIEYGTLIYQGKQKRDNKTNTISVYVKDLWVILCDTQKSVVITLYKIDLGLDDDFNKTYMNKMLDKLALAEHEKAFIVDSLTEETKKYEELISHSINMINEYKGYIKNLEELIDSYKTIVDKNKVQIDIQDRNIAEIVNSLIGKKEF